ncbi:hypothetical protein IE81DRAFT_345416 [Ceraceosorus guamensis]|uniref:Uncharacterized protein n=1 Tax=Ceraceosorus guamensis TaxID=1522189 RepID=A0A316W4N5_9BASI|nr:hypothetical protein IE81DRAFT_345416 [Ceraceosorus guamensis]PWN44719.1 hypothetical protein IE81DRAFT_345416 [Ceraceosorus guamensis]
MSEVTANAERHFSAAQAEEDRCPDVNKSVEVSLSTGSSATDSFDSSNEESFSFVKKAGDADAASTPWKGKVRQLSRGALEGPTSMTSVGAVSDISICDISVASADPNADQLTLRNVQQESAQNLAAMMQGIKAVANSHKEDHSNLQQRVVNLNETVKKQTRANNDLERKFDRLQGKMTDAVSSTVAEALKLHRLDVSDLETRVSSLDATTAATIAAATTTTAEEVNLLQDRLNTAEQTAAEVPALRERIAELEAEQAATEAQRATDSATLHAVVARLDALSGENAALHERVRVMENTPPLATVAEVDTVRAAVDDGISAIGQAVTDVDSRCSALEVASTSGKPTRGWILPVVCLLAVVGLCGVRAYADAKEPTFSSWLKALDELPEYLVRFWNGPTPLPTLGQLVKNAVLDIVGKTPSPTPAVTFSSLAHDMGSTAKATLTRLAQHTAPYLLAVRGFLRPLVEKTISHTRAHFVHCVEISAPRLLAVRAFLGPLVEKTISRLSAQFAHCVEISAPRLLAVRDFLGPIAKKTISGASAHFAHCVEISAPLVSAIIRPLVENVRSWAALANAHWMSIGLWLHRHV